MMRFKNLIYRTSLASLVTISMTSTSVLAQSNGCGFTAVFQQADEGGSQKISVFRAASSAPFNGKSPLGFVVPNVKVNTDGTRISYKIDDPRGKNGAINDIRNAYNNYRRPIADFEKIRDADWKPATELWNVLNPKIIERDKRAGRQGLPCVDRDGYLVSMTAVAAVDGGSAREGDCDQSKWVDALTLPALVLPGNSKFQSYDVGMRSIVIAMSTENPDRISIGMVGDTGPTTELGEASVAMNRTLNGLSIGDNPKNRNDAKERFQAGKTFFLVVPGDNNRVPRPLTKQNLMAFAEKKFTDWGGKTRMARCFSEIE